MKSCCEKYLIEQFGDPDIVGEIYAEYASSMKTKMGELEAAFAGADWAKVDGIAHAIKGNALAAGDNDTAETGIKLRHAAKLADADGAKKLIEDLHGLVAQL